MPCYKPIQAFRSSGGGVTFRRPEGFIDLPSAEVACGQCIGCKLDRARAWGLRIMHECSLHERNAFVTLTYDDAHVPRDGSLNKKHFQDFMKRLRARHNGRISYFHCGEYGEENGRPHYHAILFGIDFPDRQHFNTNGRGDRVYISSFLSSVWGFGNSIIGNVTLESASYCARYCLKKVTGDRADDHYKRVLEDGEIVWLQPEYATMSVAPAIGKLWFEKFADDVLPRDACVAGGSEMKVPRYYDKLRKRRDALELKSAKKERRLAATERSGDNTPERLRVREEVKLAAISSLKRSL